MAKFLESATTLEVKNVVASETFYRENLGFRPGVFYGEPPTFCIVARDKVTIFLDAIRTPHPVPLNQIGHSIFMSTMPTRCLLS